MSPAGSKRCQQASLLSISRLRFLLCGLRLGKFPPKIQPLLSATPRERGLCFGGHPSKCLGAEGVGSRVQASAPGCGSSSTGEHTEEACSRPPACAGCRLCFRWCSPLRRLSPFHLFPSAVVANYFVPETTQAYSPGGQKSEIGLPELKSGCQHNALLSGGSGRESHGCLSQLLEASLIPEALPSSKPAMAS